MCASTVFRPWHWTIIDFVAMPLFLFSFVSPYFFMLGTCLSQHRMVDRDGSSKSIVGQCLHQTAPLVRPWLHQSRGMGAFFCWGN